MDDKVEALITQLYKSIYHEDFIKIADEVVQQLEERADAFDAVEPILKLMENHSDIDYGVPGPLVHFLERFYTKGYEEKLVDSLLRKPIIHTVWMLNRIINNCDLASKRYFMDVLEKVISMPNIDNKVFLIAEHFKSLNVSYT